MKKQKTLHFQLVETTALDIWTNSSLLIVGYPPKRILLAWTPPSFFQSKHSRMKKGGHHKILVVQVNPAHCPKQRSRSSPITVWAENRPKGRTVSSAAERKTTQADTLEWISTYFHYSLDLTSSNDTHIFSRTTPINLGYRPSFLQRNRTVLKDLALSSQIFQWHLYSFLSNGHC